MKAWTNLANASLLMLTLGSCAYNPPKLEECLSKDQIPQTNWESGKIERRFYAFAGLESKFGSGEISDARYLAQYCAKNFHNSAYELIMLDNWERHAARIDRDIKEGRELIFIGHSLGCREALDAAKFLERENVQVGMVFLDAYNLDQPLLAIGHQATIPGNVKWVLNYVSAYGPFSGPRDISANILDSPNTKVENFLFKISHAGFFGEPYLATCAGDVGRMIGIVPGREPLYVVPKKPDNIIVPGIKQNPQ